MELALTWIIAILIWLAFLAIAVALIVGVIALCFKVIGWGLSSIRGVFTRT